MLREQIHEIEQERLRQLSVVLDTEKRSQWFAFLRGSAGVGIETADMLVNEILSRGLRDRRAVARCAGLTGAAPDESGQRRREKGLALAGNARVRYGMILLAWRFLQYQKDSALAHWFLRENGRWPWRYAQDDDRGFGAQAN